jgi:hypothetical protein
MSARERSGYKGSIEAFSDDLMGNRSHSDWIVKVQRVLHFQDIYKTSFLRENW